MNLIKKFFIEERTRGGVEASGAVRALVGASLLPIFNLFTRFWLESLFFSLIRLARGLTQELYLVWDLGAIAMEIWI